MINEELARKNKENYSMFGYVEGSATSEYNAVVKEAKEKIEKAKENATDEAKEKLEQLLKRFSTNYANWINKHNANGANHVSWAIAGGSNYNMKAHEKWHNKENKLWNEYDSIRNIDEEICSILYKEKIIKSDDENAIEKLKDKLTKALEEHEGYKEYNVKARKEGKPTLESWVLTNSNGRIKAIKDRIAKLEKMTVIAETTPQIETEINGIKIIDNLAAQRLQIIFPGKPDVEIREKLKKNGFRWCPTNGAWQRYRSDNAEEIAKQIVMGVA